MSNELDELKRLEDNLTLARIEVSNHLLAYRRIKANLTKTETDLISAKEEVKRAEEVVRLYKQHKILTSIDDEPREREIKRFTAAAPAALAKINAQDEIVARKELVSFRKKIEEITSKQNYARQLVEEEYIPETLQE